MTTDTSTTAKAARRPKNKDGRMPFMDHIRELRTRIIRSLIAVLVGTIVGFIVHNWVVHQISKPACSVTGVTGLGRPTAACPNGVLTLEGALSPVTVTFEVSIVVGIILACPVWSYQLWAFLAPALYKNEKRYALGFVFTAVPLFAAGVALCYSIFPTIMQVLLHTFTPHGIANVLPFQQFVGFFLRMVLVFGLSFEMPLLVVGLNFIGLLSAKQLWHWWRVVVFIIFVFAAAAVPTGEPTGMTALAVPLCVLYFAAVGVAYLNDRRRARIDPNAGLSPDEASDLDLRPAIIEQARPLDDVVDETPDDDYGDIS
jgi:sec-independent protein translocase protein TatC